MTERPWEYVFVAALLLPIVPATMVVVSLFRRATKGRLLRHLAVLTVTLLFNPLAQAFVLEPLDDERNYAFAGRVEHLELQGKTFSEVRALLGHPDYVTSWVPGMHNVSDSATATEGYTCWGYKPLRGYWFGSHSQLFFRQGRVYSVEANDD